MFNTIGMAGRAIKRMGRERHQRVAKGEAVPDRMPRYMRLNLLAELTAERDPPLTHDELRMIEGSMRGAYNHKLAGDKAGER